MKLRFGTDGVRGRAFDELTVADAVAIAGAASAVLDAEQVFIAHDSRESGPALVAGLAEGFRHAGVEPRFIGIAPTPAVAYLAARDGGLGAMVSASHNPWFDNGIKIFGPGGRKLTDAQQGAIEQRLGSAPSTATTVADLSTVARAEHRLADYMGQLRETLANGSTDVLAGSKIVIDAANGAASHLVGPLFTDLGAEVVLLSSEPDGRNINDGCGSTYPEHLAETVVATGSDFGLALDGDADRLLAVDHTGTIVDGDEVIAICAIDLAARGALADNTVVVTVMTNLGFRLSMAERGISVVETPVGDRHVLRALDAHGWTLGGEQSGHVIFGHLATTGDGMLTALQLADTVVRSHRTLAELAATSMTRLPQVLRNVPVAAQVPNVAELLADDIEAAEAELGSRGRVLIRASGTEPLIRVMVEAPTEASAEQTCDRLVSRVEARFGASSPGGLAP